VSVWDAVVGQSQTVATLSRAASDPAAMTHAWLLTGPPGSGRSTAARAFAAALECAENGCGVCRECRTAIEGSHADVTVVATEGLSIKVEDTRALVQEAGLRPSVGAWRVIVIEDADRLTERAADALLKALEEPTPRTVWVLCAPSLEDVIVTIRSRSRHVRLRTPPVRAVAELLTRRDGIPEPMALYAARAAQSHVGLARRLALDEGARNRRHEVISLPLKIRTVGDAVGAAADLAGIADEENTASAATRDAAERTRLLETLGADPAARTQPPQVRSQLAALERDQKARATRFARDMVDRSLVDLLSMYRDALLVATGAGVDLVNAEAVDQVRALASAVSPDRLLQCMDAIGLARERINLSVAPLLALEAMAVALQTPPGHSG
jgi:DNA polymerase-3 subunit delta'